MQQASTFRSGIPVILVAISILLIGMAGCKKVAYKDTTTPDVNITGYLQNNPATFSLMTEILDRSGDAGFMGAYGKPGYTLFAPTDNAVKEWLKSIGKASVADVPVADLKNMVNFHLILDTLSTKNFTDGKIRQLTAYGQYLTSGILNDNGTSTYIINRQGKIIQSNIIAGNGVIHVVDHVLTPQLKTLSKLIEENSRYSIFTQALKETGFYDSLNTVQPASLPFSARFRTVILESDSAIKAAGYTSYAALKAALSKIPGSSGGDPKNHADSLWLYVAYHASASANYLGDIVTTSTLQSLAPNEIVSTKLTGSTILLNEVEFNGNIEPGAPILRDKSDVTASNGVLHESKNFYRIKARVPTATFFDVTAVDGILTNTQYGRGFLAININNKSSLSADILMANYNAQGAAYNFSNASATTGIITNLNDYLSVAMTDPANNNGSRTRWLDVRTPLLVKGQYKVWICYGNQGGINPAVYQIFMNPGTATEQALPNLVTGTNTLTAAGVSLTDPNADNLMEAQGYKRYMATVNDKAVNKSGVAVVGDAPIDYAKSPARLAGTVTIKTTSRQWIRFQGVKSNGNSSVCVDMVHFIPVDQDQQYPRFSKSGTQFKRP